MPDACLGSNQWRSQKFSMRVYGGVLGLEPSAAESHWGLSGLEAWCALGNFCNFLIKIRHLYEYFDQNSYFKNITHQLKVFEKQSKRIK